MRKKAIVKKTREQIIEREFSRGFFRVFGRKAGPVAVYEAPAAEAWVVIHRNNDAWVAMQDSDDFVFWGTSKKPIEFTIPEDWK